MRAGWARIDTMTDNRANNKDNTPGEGDPGANPGGGDARAAARRLPKEARRRQLLETARAIVREEGADRLTLGHLAVRAGVSKPVVYDHFGTPSGLLIELYRWLDTEKVDAFRSAMADDPRDAEETFALLAAAYVDCAADQTGEFHAVGAALGGSTEKAAVFQELQEHCVQMFVSVLAPHSGASKADLERCCVGLVGAGEALAASLVRGRSSRKATVKTFAALIRGCMT
jgi:AcrR family transcriptional regulator